MLDDLFFRATGSKQMQLSYTPGRHLFDPFHEIFPFGTFVKRIKDDIDTAECVQNVVKGALERLRRGLGFAVVTRVEEIR